MTRKSTVNITADATPGSYAIDRGEFIVGTTVVCSAVSTPYNCAWVVPKAANKTYQIRANAYDSKGNAGTSTTVTVTAK